MQLLNLSFGYAYRIKYLKRALLIHISPPWAINDTIRFDVQYYGEVMGWALPFIIYTIADESTDCEHDNTKVCTPTPVVFRGKVYSQTDRKQ